MEDPVFDEAKAALERLSSDPAAQELAREREIWAYFYRLDLRLTREEAEAKGEAKGRRAVLRKQLESKFGGLSAANVTRLENGTDEELGQWAERILSASAVEDVFA